MTISSLASFIEALKTDASLKKRLLHAQEEALVNIRREAEGIVALAAEAGFDLSEWAKRPVDGRPEPAAAEGDDCSATCCLVGTSTTW